MNEETIFANALEKPAAERGAYLAEACGNDEALRKRLEGLLAASEKVGNFMANPAVAPALDPAAMQTLAASPDHAPLSPAGERDRGEGTDSSNQEPLTFLTQSAHPDSLGRLGHYEVLQVLGRGGFGIVYRAFDETLQRVVALKVMAPELAVTSPARKRFLREARSSAQVRHENVVQVYEVAEQPLPYLAMEFIPGETLQQKLDRVGPLDVPETLRIGRQIAEGLAAAHAMDLIHRDIKPGNVLLESGHQKVKITDFGLARAADDASISQSGVLAGTPMYMAPEQAQGETLDQRADLFSLGSVLYQMVSGRPPFRANTTVAVLMRVAEDQPRAIREIIPETPQWLCDIISKLHAKNPDDRYQSAREVADVLANCEAQLQANARLKDDSRIPRGRRQPSGRWKWMAAAAALLLPIITLGVTDVAGVTHLFRLGPPRKDANQSEPAPNTPSAAKDVQEAWAKQLGIPIDPDEDCEFGAVGKSLSIKVPGTYHTLDLRDTRKLNAPRALKEIDGDFVLTVKVTGDYQPRGPATREGRYPFNGAGILLWSDADNFIRLERAAILRDGKIATYINFQERKGGNPVADNNKAFPVGKCYLHVERTGNRITAAASTDGSMWDELKAKEVNWPPKLQAGVAALNASSQAFTVTFEEFSLKASGPSGTNDKPSSSAIAPFTDADVQRIRALPAPQQVEEVRKELKLRNHGSDGEMKTTPEGDVVTELHIVTDTVTDIAPIRVFDALRVLNCSGTWTGKRNGLLADLTLLKGMKLASLTHLNLNNTKVTDAGMVYFEDSKALTDLNLHNTDVSDAGLDHFKDCKDLRHLDLGGCTKVTNAGLAHFKDCKNLRFLWLGHTKVTDAGLADFSGMTLRKLGINNTGITDLTPLQRMPLEDIRLTPKDITKGLDIIRNMKSLKTIGIDGNHSWPAEEFWDRYGKGEFK